MIDRRVLRVLALVLMAFSALGLAACGSSDGLYVPNLLEKASDYNGKDITVDGAYIGRANPSTAVLALGVSTLDNGLDAKPVGDQIWLENFPQQTNDSLHQPGDAVYGFVRVSGQFEANGQFGPDGSYKYRIQVKSAEPIETVKRVESRIGDAALGDGKIALGELMKNPAASNGQTITTQGYYFWNGPLAVLAEGVSTEEDGSSPQPIGKQIWVDGFPPDLSGKLHLGPNNSYVWGKIEVTGQLQSGGAFGKDGAYTEHLQISSAQALEQSGK